MVSIPDVQFALLIAGVVLILIGHWIYIWVLRLESEARTDSTPPG